MSNTASDQAALYAALTAPFPVEDIEFKPGRGGSGPLIYITARAVADRLDQAVGPGNWSFTWVPVITEALPGVKQDTKVQEMLGTHLRAVRGTLSIYGVPKEDIGNYSDIDPDKGAISDALKRCAVLWGVGRYLYGLDVRDERAYVQWYNRQTGTASTQGNGSEPTPARAGKPLASTPPPRDMHDTEQADGYNRPATKAQYAEITALLKELEMTNDQCKDVVKQKYDTDSLKNLNYHQLADLIKYLRELIVPENTADDGFEDI